MCCCGKPVVNGELGYRWQPNDAPRIRPINAPAIDASDTLLYDEPGRCGGLDCHSHHYRLVRSSSSVWLYVRHGGGDESLRLSTTPIWLDAIATMDSNVRYWTFSAIYHAYSDGKHKGHNTEAERWRKAAAEKRIKTRKLPSQGFVRVEIIGERAW